MTIERLEQIARTDATVASYLAQWRSGKYGSDFGMLCALVECLVIQRDEYSRQLTSVYQRSPVPIPDDFGQKNMMEWPDENSPRQLLIEQSGEMAEEVYAALDQQDGA